MAATSERPSLSPPELDAVTGALALQLLSICKPHPPAVGLIAIARAQAQIVSQERDQEHALRAANQMLRLYHQFIVDQGKTLELPAPGLTQ